VIFCLFAEDLIYLHKKTKEQICFARILSKMSQENSI